MTMKYVYDVRKPPEKIPTKAELTAKAEADKKAQLISAHREMIGFPEVKESSQTPTLEG